MDPYTEYYSEQAGGSWHDRIGPVYRASFTRQRGRGLGSIFRNIISYVTPLFKSAWGALKREAVDAGSNIMSDIVSGDGSTPLKEVASKRLVEARDRLAAKMKGSGRRRRLKRVVKKRATRKKVGRRAVVRKRKVRRAVRTKTDIFGIYK